jgi:membrane glycosyltransferase
VLAGHDAGWKVQRRDGRVPLREITRRHAWHTGVGVLLGVAAGLASPWLLLWMSPIILGLVLAIPLSALTARPDVGQLTRRLGLFRIPEESAPPPVLRERDRRVAAAAIT